MPAAVQEELEELEQEQFLCVEISPQQAGLEELRVRMDVQAVAAVVLLTALAALAALFLSHMVQLVVVGGVVEVAQTAMQLVTLVVVVCLTGAMLLPAMLPVVVVER